jgi:hypothetical protein
MSRFNPTKDEQIEVLTQEREKFRGLFHKAQGMLDHDEIKRLRHIIVKQAMQIKELEELKGIKWPSMDLPIM